MTPHAYIEATAAHITFAGVLVGLNKTPVLALVIGLIACGQGLATRGGAAAVGGRTTTAVVQSIFSVISPVIWRRKRLPRLLLCSGLILEGKLGYDPYRTCIAGEDRFWIVKVAVARIYIRLIASTSRAKAIHVIHSQAVTRVAPGNELRMVDDVRKLRTNTKLLCLCKLQVL